MSPNVTCGRVGDVSCGTTTTLDLASYGDGDYTLSVVATDQAGNSSVAGSADYSLDATAPLAPVVSLTSPGSSPGNSSLPQFSVSNPGDASPGALTYSCVVTETSVSPNVTVAGSDVTCGSTTTVDLGATGDGDYLLSVTATDAAGNVSMLAGTASYSLDTAAPGTPTVTLSSPASSPASDASPQFTVTNTGDTSPGGLTYSCVVTETSVTPTVTLPGSAVTCGPTTTLHLGSIGDGDYTLAVTATDQAGNSSLVAGTAAYTLDTAAPAIPVVTLSSPAASPGTSTSPQFSVTDPDSSPGGPLTYACSVTGPSVVPTSAISCGPTTTVDLSAAADGDYTLSVTATDAVGNTSPTAGTAGYTLDSTVPGVPVVTLSSPASSPGNSASPQFSVTDPDSSPGGLTYSCTVTETSVTPAVTLPAAT